MRTTLLLDDPLMIAAKQEAARRKVTLTHLIHEALRDYLRPANATAAHTLQWVTASGALMPGVDLADRDALYTLMEEDASAIQLKAAEPAAPYRK